MTSNASQDTTIDRNRQRSRIFSLAAILFFGAGLGLSVFTFGYAKGHSYLLNDPEACANCHVMQDHVDSWRKSSHHAVATCNDCHLPHDFAGKWWVKADNGFFHSLAFTAGGYPDPIRIKPRNAEVVQSSCLHCHQEFVHELLPWERGGEMAQCVQCHQGVGHALR